MRVVAALALLVSLVAVAVDRLDGPGGNFSLEKARAFEEFPLYYAGEDVDGLGLEAVLRRNGTANYVSFVYGDCEASSDGGCAPPAEVQVWPSGMRNAGSYDPALPGTSTGEPTRIRGRPAAFFDDGTRVEIYAEAATIVVFSDTRARVLAVAEALRCVRHEGARSDPLSC